MKKALAGRRVPRKVGQDDDDESLVAAEADAPGKFTLQPIIPCLALTPYHSRHPRLT